MFEVSLILSEIRLSNFEVTQYNLYHCIISCKRGSHARKRSKCVFTVTWFIVVNFWKYSSSNFIILNWKMFEVSLILSETRLSNFEVTQYNLYHCIILCKRGSHARTRPKCIFVVTWFIVVNFWKYSSSNFIILNWKMFELSLILSETRLSNFEIT